MIGAGAGADQPGLDQQARGGQDQAIQGQDERPGQARTRSTARPHYLLIAA